MPTGLPITYLDLAPLPDQGAESALLWLDDLTEKELGKLTDAMFERLSGRAIALGTIPADRYSRALADKSYISSRISSILGRARIIHLDGALTPRERSAAQIMYPNERFDKAGIGEQLVSAVLWDTCNQTREDGEHCVGAQVRAGRCLDHLEDRELEETLRPSTEEAPRDLDIRGIRLSSGRLDRILAACRTPDDHIRTGAIRLELAAVQGDVNLTDAAIDGAVSLAGAEIEGGVYLAGARIDGNLYMAGLKVSGDLNLANIKVAGDISSADAKIDGSIYLAGAIIGGGGSFDVTNVAGDLQLEASEFTRWVSLNGSFSSMNKVDLSGAHFLGGLTARLGNAEVLMDRVELRAPSVVADLSRIDERGETIVAPHLLSLTGTDVTALTLSGVDLRPCRFSGAFDLDNLRIEGSLRLAGRPHQWQTRRKVLAEEHQWRHRHSRFWSQNWYPKECRALRLSDEERLAAPEPERGAAPERVRTRAREVSEVYRALRKGREDSKDEPGAADFYYGEMEMRRRASEWGVERVLLTCYWFISGYGLRVWRALLALAALIAVASILFAVIGLAHSRVTVYQPTKIPGIQTVAPTYRTTTIAGPRPGWSTAFDYTIESATSLIRMPQSPPQLTGWGEILTIVIRFSGPALLALAVLALRSRVKR